MIDEGETDWKILAIDSSDPLAPQLNSLEDIELLMPGLLSHTHRWFQIYKVCQRHLAPSSDTFRRSQPESRPLSSDWMASSSQLTLRGNWQQRRTSNGAG